MSLEDKVALVTGSSGGLDAQICYEAAKRGAIVISCARRMTFIEGVGDECRRLSGKEVYAFKMDVNNSESVDELYEKVMEEVGHVDILINNTGSGVFEGFLTFDLGKTHDMFEVSILGVMVLTQKFVIDIAEKRQGHIASIAPMAGEMTTVESTVYFAMEFAVLGFSGTLRLELKPLDVTVTIVNPGPIKTNSFDKADPNGSYLKKIRQIVLEPAKLTKMIVRNMKHPRREINQPFILKVASKFYTLFPTTGDYLASEILNKK